MPVSNYCVPCLVRYDAVAKLETSEQDQVRSAPAPRCFSYQRPVRRAGKKKVAIPGTNFLQFFYLGTYSTSDLDYFAFFSCQCNFYFLKNVRSWTFPFFKAYVMHRSGMSNHAYVEHNHRTRGGASDREEIRREFFSAVPCQVLKDLHDNVYRMDFELFEYTTDPFMQLCDSKTEEH